MSNTEQYELIKTLHAALKDLVHQIPNDERLADWRLDFAESADLKADQFFKDNPIPPSPVQGVEEAAVKSAEDNFAQWVDDRISYYESIPLTEYGNGKKEAFLEVKDEYASQFKASRSKGVGMDAEAVMKFLEEEKGPLGMSDHKTIDRVMWYLKTYFIKESAPLSDNSQEEGRIYPEDAVIKAMRRAFEAGDTLCETDGKSADMENSCRYILNDLRKEYLSESPGSEGKEEKKCAMPGCEKKSMATQMFCPDHRL